MRFSRKEEEQSCPAVSQAPTSRTLAGCSTKSARRYISYKLEKQLVVLPIAVTDSGQRTITVVSASDAPQDIAAIKFLVESEVKVAVLPSQIVTDAIEIAYHNDGEEFTKALQEVQKTLPLQQIRKIRDPADESEVSKLVTHLIQHAYAIRASDIHLEPQEEHLCIRVRVGEELLQGGELLSLAAHRRMVQRIKVLASLNIATHHLPQDGSFVCPCGKNSLHIRVSIVPTVYGEKVVLRLLSNVERESIESLGFEKSINEKFYEFLKEREGLLLLGGATGTGKSTTLYALAKELAKQGFSVMTIEDPVERMVPGLSQTAINEERGYTFSKALRSILRQDPDAIVIGEIRDNESAKIAFHAALTGHLVLATVHSGSIEEIFLRIRELGIETDITAQALRIIAAQNLQPVLCDRCKIVDIERSSTDGGMTYKKVGCPFCGHTGYQSMKPCIEILTIKGEIKKNIRDKHPFHKIHKVALSKNLLLTSD